MLAGRPASAGVASRIAIGLGPLGPAAWTRDGHASRSRVSGAVDGGSGSVIAVVSATPRRPTSDPTVRSGVAEAVGRGEPVTRTLSGDVTGDRHMRCSAVEHSHAPLRLQQRARWASTHRRDLRRLRRPARTRRWAWPRLPASDVGRTRQRRDDRVATGCAVPHQPWPTHHAPRVAATDHAAERHGDQRSPTTIRRYRRCRPARSP